MSTHKKALNTVTTPIRCGSLQHLCRVLQDAENFKSKMNSLAYGSAMMQAAKDFQRVSRRHSTFIGLPAGLPACLPAPGCGLVLRCIPLCAHMCSGEQGCKEPAMADMALYAAKSCLRASHALSSGFITRESHACAQEAMAAEAAAANAPRHAEVDVEDLLDDPELEQLHRDRLLELQREAERRAVMQQKGHGEYTVRRHSVALSVSGISHGQPRAYLQSSRCLPYTVSIIGWLMNCVCSGGTMPVTELSGKSAPAMISIRFGWPGSWTCQHAHHRQAIHRRSVLACIISTVATLSVSSPHVGQAAHALLQEVAEGDFLKVVTETQKVVVHFCHREFTRCKIMDKHLTALTRKFFGTRFVKVSAPVRSRCLPLERGLRHH